MLISRFLESFHSEVQHLEPEKQHMNIKLKAPLSRLIKSSELFCINFWNPIKPEDQKPRRRKKGLKIDNKTKRNMPAKEDGPIVDG